ncbi:odorant receptor 4-like [Solenopsis invicta]|uniref:odorant receptor 4-like n=1 Tax=Solenopsis invicta TaxID=13686 RepID=UPI00193D4A12|nr:odorant receptor 4-like [Solenopsis invicta]
MKKKEKMQPITKNLSRKNRNEDDFNYAVQVTRIVMRMMGVWPIPSYASNVEKILTRLQNVICYFLFAVVVVPGLLQLFLKEHDFKRRVRLLGPILNCFIGCTKYSLLLHHAREIQYCLKQARQDWRDTVDSKDRNAMLSKAKVGRRFAIFTAAFMYVGGLSYRTIFPLVKGRVLTPMNTTVRVLACPSYFIKFDEQATPAYEIIYTLQFFSGLLAYSVTVGGVGLAAFFILHVCGQLRVLIGKIQRINDMSEPDDRVVEILFANIVEHQIKVKNFLKEVEETMRYVLLVEVVGCTIILCLAGYYVLWEYEASGVTAMLVLFMVFISFVISIFINCYVGQMLMDESMKFGSMTSTTNWHRLFHKRARSLILIMAVSNIPEKISAGKLIEMSLPTFNNIIRTSMAYFNLLRKFI